MTETEGGRAASETRRDADEDAYGGLLGAFPYALRRSDSLLFRSYVLVGGTIALVVGAIVTAAVVVQLGKTASAAGGTLTLSRSFFLVVGLLAVLPMLAPVLLVARRHRRGEPSGRYDALLGVAGYLFVLSLYLGLLISIPETFVLDGELVRRQPPSGPFAPVVRVLYGLPEVAFVLPPVLATAFMALVHRVGR